MRNRVIYEYKHDGIVVEFKFITQPRRGWFNENVKPMIEILKRVVPATHREYNPDTSAWTLSTEYWEFYKKLLELSGWFCKPITPAAGTKPPREYVENFHYAPVATKQEENIAASLSKYLGVEIKTQELSELKKLYRTKARELHPDFGGDAAAMSELNRLWTLYTNNGVTQ